MKYEEAKKEAQRKANETGFDHGVHEHAFGYSCFMLPQKKNRFGSDLRCEVVSCMDYEKQQPGHGDKPAMPPSPPKETKFLTFHQQMQQRRTPLNSFVAMLLLKDGEPPFPWSGKSEPMSTEFGQKSQANQWLQVHDLIRVDPTSKQQKWIWTEKGLRYKETIRSANLRPGYSLSEFPEVPNS